MALGVDVERDSIGQAPARRRGGLPPFYVAIWVVLSSMSLTYLTMLSIRPDLADGLGRQVAAVFGTDAGPAAMRHSSDERARAEIVELRRTLDALNSDLDAVRRQIVSREEREQAFVARLAAVEAHKMSEPAIPLSTASIDRPRNAPLALDETVPGRTAPSRIAERAEPEPPAPAAVPEPPQRRERPRDDRVAVATAPAPAQVKAPVAEPAGPKGIQIATGPSVDALRISWMLLSERHKEILRRYEPRFVPSPSGTTPAYRLIAGPIENTTAANRVCSELKARRVTCGVSAFGGEPL